MPQDKFFIAGMPRCRTAWFSAYLSAYDGVRCYHELLNGLTTKQAFYDAMEAPGYIGNSDSGLFITDFQERWPDAPTVILLRDPRECQKSIEAFIGIEPSIELLERQYEEAKEMQGFHVEHHLIDYALAEIHDYLGIPIDESLATQFANTNIQLRTPRVCMDSYYLWTDFERAS